MYTCRRKTNRWTFTTFMYLLDVAAYNSFVLFRIKNPSEFTANYNRQRRVHLEKLAIGLIQPCIEARFEDKKSKNFIGCQSPILKAFTKTGLNLLNRLGDSPNKSPTSDQKKTKKRCQICPYKINANKYGEFCTKCNISVCPIHRKDESVCNNCSKYTKLYVEQS